MYTGNIENEKRNGKGCMHYADGDIYIGIWIDDFPEGKGIMIYEDQSRYEGEF